MRGDLSRMRLAELAELENRAELDLVVRAVALSTGEGYLDALESVQRWGSAAAQKVVGARQLTRAEDLPLYAIIAESPIALDRFERDVEEIGGQQLHSERVMALDNTLPPEPEGEVVEGRVMLDAGADVARLLTDDYEIERDWQRVRQLDVADFAGPEGRQRFETERRLYLESGQSLVATIEHGRRETELQHRRARAERAQAAKERHEAGRRAKARRQRG